MRAVVIALLALVAACLERPDECADGRLCPAGSRCDGRADRCIVDPDHCDDFADGAWCHPDGARLCIAGACEKGDCGDSYVDERFEECDQGPANNDLEPDRCRADCRKLSCGDGILDDGEKPRCLGEVARRPGVDPPILLRSSP